MILAGGMIVSSTGAAQALTADDVLNNMTTDQRYSYIAGVVGGLAYSRYLREQPDQAGMSCIYDWYHDAETDSWPQIATWFARHPDRQVEPLLYVLIKRECGE
ncbi:hypothetical protein OCA8868_03166 [Octadecabacter ascidiaceicola]|uniref:Rap1a immunity protein domain-containing protein n=2 Tax=Octadecabacter ascidiaceicola TaxID=1655543 RepID=A0A238KP65_9RHOB|nr:hypothetical protein OCA8868_03166 [Octadecabacter ascidiaceicola]